MPSIAELITQINSVRVTLERTNLTHQTPSNICWQLKKTLATLYCDVAELYEKQGDDRNAIKNYYAAYATNKSARAKKKLNLDCSQGDPNPLNPIGRLTIPSDPEESFMLGLSRLSGIGATQNLAAASVFFGTAAEANHPAAMSMLAFMFLNEKGISKDIKEGLRFYRLAEQLDNTDAKNALGRIYEQGKHDVTQDLQKAARLFQSSAAQGDPRGQIFHGNMLMTGAGKPVTPKDINRAIEFFTMASKQGEHLADCTLALEYFRNPELKNIPAAVRHCRVAAATIPEAEKLLAHIYKQDEYLQDSSSTSSIYAINLRQDAKNFQNVNNKAAALNALKHCARHNPTNFDCYYHLMWAGSAQDIPTNFDAFFLKNPQGMLDAIKSDQLLTQAQQAAVLAHIASNPTLKNLLDTKTRASLTEKRKASSEDSSYNSDDDIPLPTKKSKPDKLSPKLSFLNGTQSSASTNNTSTPSNKPK